MINLRLGNRRVNRLAITSAVFSLGTARRRRADWHAQRAEIKRQEAVGVNTVLGVVNLVFYVVTILTERSKKRAFRRCFDGGFFEALRVRKTQ